KREDRETEREVEAEDPAPRKGGDEHAAEHRAERERDAGHAGPDAERTRTLAAVRVDLPDERQRSRLAGRRADAHHDPRRDQERRARRERTEKRACAEDRDADEQ